VTTPKTWSASAKHRRLAGDRPRPAPPRPTSQIETGVVAAGRTKGNFSRTIHLILLTFACTRNRRWELVSFCSISADALTWQGFPDAGDREKGFTLCSTSAAFQASSFYLARRRVEQNGLGVGVQGLKMFLLFDSGFYGNTGNARRNLEEIGIRAPRRRRPSRTPRPRAQRPGR